MVQVRAFCNPESGFCGLNQCLLPFLFLFSIKFLVEQENEQVDIDGGPIEELHHCHPFILQLEEILRNKQQTNKKRSDTSNLTVSIIFTNIQ